MQQISSTATIDSYQALESCDARPETIRIITDEGLLPSGLVNRLDSLYPQYSSLRSVAPPIFTGRENYGGLEGFREVCQVLSHHGIDIGHLVERELFIDVYRFLATKHTLNSIDWAEFETDSMFQLVFPQPGMIRRDVVEAYGSAGTREEQEADRGRVHARDQPARWPSATQQTMVHHCGRRRRGASR